MSQSIKVKVVPDAEKIYCEEELRGNLIHFGVNEGIGRRRTQAEEPPDACCPCAHEPLTCSTALKWRAADRLGGGTV